jgi:hypothetical protein
MCVKVWTRALRYHVHSGLLARQFQGEIKLSADYFYFYFQPTDVRLYNWRGLESLTLPEHSFQLRPFTPKILLLHKDLLLSISVPNSLCSGPGMDESTRRGFFDLAAVLFQATIRPFSPLRSLLVDHLVNEGFINLWKGQFGHILGV